MYKYILILSIIVAFVGCCYSAEAVVCPRIACTPIDKTKCQQSGGTYTPAGLKQCCPKCTGACMTIKCAGADEKICRESGGQYIPANPQVGQCCSDCISFCSRVRCAEGDKVKCEVEGNTYIERDESKNICCGYCSNCNTVDCVPVDEKKCKAEGKVYSPAKGKKCCSTCEFRVPATPRTSGRVTIEPQTLGQLQ